MAADKASLHFSYCHMWWISKTIKFNHIYFTPIKKKAQRIQGEFNLAFCGIAWNMRSSCNFC